MDVKKLLKEQGFLIGLGVLALVALVLWFVLIGDLDSQLDVQVDELKDVKRRIDDYERMAPADLPVQERVEYLTAVKAQLEAEREAIKTYYEALDRPLEAWFDDRNVQDEVRNRNFPRSATFSNAYLAARDALVSQNRTLFAADPNEALPPIPITAEDETLIRSVQKRFWIQRALILACRQAAGETASQPEPAVRIRQINVLASARAREGTPFIDEWQYTADLLVRPSHVAVVVSAILGAREMPPFEIHDIAAEKDQATALTVNEPTLSSFPAGQLISGALDTDDFYIRTSSDHSQAQALFDEVQSLRPTVIPDPWIHVTIHGVVVDFKTPIVMETPRPAGGRGGRDTSGRGGRNTGRDTGGSSGRRSRTTSDEE